MTSETTLGRLRESRIVAVLRCDSARDAVEVADVLVAAGLTAVEVTLTTPGALDAIRHLAERFGSDIVLGAGTITTAGQAREAADAGADFLVSPGCPPVLVEQMRATGRLAIPGVLTPTEVMTAAALDVRLVKLFPGSAFGPSYLRSLKAPFPDLEFLPTGGIARDNMADWFAAGAFALGIGGSLAPPQVRDDRARTALGESARAFLAGCRPARDQG